MAGRLQATAAYRGLDPRHDLLGVARLVDPVVGAEPAARAPAAPRSSPWVPTTTPSPGIAPQIRSRKSQAIGPSAERSSSTAFRLHGQQPLGRHRARQEAVLPAGSLKPLREHGDESPVRFDHGYPEGAPFVHSDVKGNERTDRLTGSSQKFHAVLIRSFTPCAARAASLGRGVLLQRARDLTPCPR